jgi:broad specificity phosphatase PhoE
MGILLLVRHAQASFLEPHYDKLSKLGEAQATLLGRFWARGKIAFDRVCVGPCVRQQDSARLVGDAYEEAGLEFPELFTMPEFDEYHAEAVFEGSLPQLIASEPDVRDLYHAFQCASDDIRRRAAFQKLFEAVTRRWVRQEIYLQGVETWQQFCSRVNSGLEKALSAGGRGERIVIFTSGGPIAVAMQRALQLSPENALQASWMSRNSSWSEFLYAPGRFTLSSFNVHGHLDDPGMLTYR